MAWSRTTGTVCAAVLVFFLAIVPVHAQEQAQLFVTQEDGFGRLILSFPERDTLPEYEVKLDNGILSVVFGEQVRVTMPDVAATVPDYISVARTDPDLGGVRFALRTPMNFNRIEAGEKLFIDLLPLSWQGLPPGLPQAVIDELAERARLAAIAAERERKAREARDLNPRAEVRIGRNPTFMRLHFAWNVDTEASWTQEGTEGHIAFEWPVEVDVRDLAIDLPSEVLGIASEKTVDGARIDLQLAEGVEPRFFANSPREFVLDIDLAGADLPEISAEDLAADVAAAETAKSAEAEETVSEAVRLGPELPITPFVTNVGSTVRIVFPFEREVPAAVFQRGDTLWMLFDTGAGINPLEDAELMNGLVSRFEATPAGDTQVVRMDLSRQSLATLGSEGRAWVLSLGDMLLNPTEPLELERRLDTEGHYEMTANLQRPVRVHEFRDPLVGDLLQVVTAYPPARGVTRSFDFVDFAALRSIHGLVVKPRHDEVELQIDNKLAVISASRGLTLSPPQRSASRDFFGEGEARASFVDLAAFRQEDPATFSETTEDLFAAAASAEGEAQDEARLELAQHYLANQLALEAVGVLELLESDIEDKDLARKARMSLAIANTLAHRPTTAIALLQGPMLADEIDAVFWRSMARVETYDFDGAVEDLLTAEPVLESYPDWVRARFLLSGIRAAVETEDAELAERLLERLDFAKLDLRQASLYQLLSGRLDELQGRTDEAIDTYGQVIAAEVRPTRAEAIYRTLKLLDEAGTLDLAKATETLSAESLLWRGDQLEADMQRMLADFYFRDGQYRLGFETARQAVSEFAETPGINVLRDQAQTIFTDLFLNGRADALGTVDALGIYYDFRQLTPPGARGDEMVRNLARRLVEVDLLEQAAELLEYQLDNRLTGVAKSQTAADLAVIYLADRQPQLALEVLNRTRLPGLSETLTRQRRVLEVRALIEGGRYDLALDMMRDMNGRDIDVLRVDAHWKAERYADAASALEAMYYGAGETLEQKARMDIVKAAVGYVLDDDRIGLSRLRAKFGERLSTTPEWPMFDFVTRTVDPQGVEFRQVAREIASLDGLNAFLAAYHEVYATGGALTPLHSSQGDSVVAGL